MNDSESFRVHKQSLLMVNKLTKLSSHQVEIFNPIQNKTNQQPQPTYF